MKVINDKLMVRPDYKKRLIEVSKDCAKFAGIQSNIKGRAFMEALHLDFEIQHEIKHVFVVKPTFAQVHRHGRSVPKVAQSDSANSHPMGGAVRSTGLVDELSFPVSCPVSKRLRKPRTNGLPRNSAYSCDESPNGF
jgi:hypothetical protein